MQSDWKEIYKITALKTGKSENLYKDIGNFVFASLNKNLKKPKSLIIKLKGIGYWYLRKYRIERKVEDFDPDKPVKINKWAESMGIFPHENKLEMIKIFKERLKDYDEYIKLRGEVKAERYKTQQIIKPKE